MKDINDARAWMGDALKWGNKTYLPFGAEDIIEIISAYERALDEAEADSVRQLAEQREHFIKEKAELTGRIGGLQKRVAALEKKP